ncbi:hypothetical protein DINM_003558 [Dirofilaria immitis]|nr:hypothetical protein [Dirofilaria immitis]
MADSNLYAKKLILAPMVRAGRTPLRILALEYGADLVYTEEIVDQKLLSSQRSVNDTFGTIDYTCEDDVVLRICDRNERQKCVLQIGTSDAQRAADVVKKCIGNDVAAIDINMGCPKPFSIAGGMGAALLGNPEKAKEIVQTCVSTSAVPISCKIRVLDKRDDTLEFAKMLERCGVSAIGIHGRRRNERRGDMNRINEIREVTEAVSVPIIANGFSGSIKEYDDIIKFWEQSNASSACKYDENFTSTKYVVQRILGSKQETDERGRQSVLAATVLDICKAWSIGDTYYNYKNVRRRAIQKRRFDVDSETGIINGSEIKWSVNTKMCLKCFCGESGIKRPLYQCKLRETDKKYEATVEVSSKKFSSRIGQPNKKMAEQTLFERVYGEYSQFQVAALAALIGLGKREKLPGDWEEL